jgi:MFS family permease
MAEPELDPAALGGRSLGSERMTRGARRVQRTYLVLTLLSTLAASFIWGVNTLFLLDAGLNNTQAFAANAFFTAGQVVFEVPTGVIADTWGRRASYLLGSATLLVSTLLYLGMWQLEAPFWGWAVSSVLIGVGFTFFSGAVEAWLVDALYATEYDGELETVFARGQTTAGIAMLGGSVAGGFIAQASNLGVPYILRAALLAVTFVAAFILMKDLGFTPQRTGSLVANVRRVVTVSLDSGWRNRPVRWLMLASPFTAGVGVYAFYALQPYLLELYGDDEAFGIAGLAAAIVAGAQILGGVVAPLVRRLFSRRTHALLVGGAAGTVALALIGVTSRFWIAIVLLVVWALTFSAVTPLRQAYLNGLISSEQRATVLSFDALMGSAGGVGAQPALGRAADALGYSASYVISAIISAVALPFLALARREDAASDLVERD